MAWIGGAIAGVGSLLGGALSGSGSGGGTYGGTSQVYMPQNVSAADTGWYNAFNNQQNTVNQVGQTVSPLYQQALTQQQAINYDPYLQASQQAGSQYGNLAALAGQQAGTYGQAATAAQGQQSNLYGLANQVAQTAFDPQNALYAQTQQQLQDQVNAGQAARGLGNSPVGGQEYNQAMSNFDINWQNAQLQRQAQGISSAAAASTAGAQQNQIMGADLAAQLSAQGQVPTYTQQSAQTPLTAQQYVAGMPATNASAYQTNMGQLANLYGGVENQALPYMTGGVGAEQTQQQFAAQQQAALSSGLAGIGYNLGTGLSNTWGSGSSGSGNSWLGNLFGSGNTGDTTTQGPMYQSMLSQGATLNADGTLSY